MNRVAGAYHVDVKQKMFLAPPLEGQWTEWTSEVDEAQLFEDSDAAFDALHLADSLYPGAIKFFVVSEKEDA